jgi:hypothetical protein
MGHLRGDLPQIGTGALAIGNSGRVAQIKAATVGIKGVDLAQHGQTAEAAVEQSDEEAQEECVRKDRMPAARACASWRR